MCNSDGKVQLVITDIERGELVCSKCGLVISDKIQEGSQESESYSFSTVDQEENKSTAKITTGSRIQSAPYLSSCYNVGLSTIIGKQDKDAHGKEIDHGLLSTIEKLRTWDYRTKAHSPAHSSLIYAFDSLANLKTKLRLPNAALENSAYIYRKAQERGLIRGRSIHIVMAAAMYIACRAIGVPRTLGDIATIINIKPKELASTYRLLVLELGLKIPMSDPIKCIASIANKVNLSEKTKRQAINIMRHIISKKQEVTAGKHPMALAAAILYLLSIDMGENITQNSIAQAAGITQVTVRNRCKDVKPVILEHNF